MSFQKCSNPFYTQKHDLNWVSSYNIQPVSAEFLNEYHEFIPKKLRSGMLICENCKTKIINLGKEFYPCCNPLEKSLHRTRQFRVVTQTLQQQLLMFKNNIKEGDRICLSCRRDISRKVQRNPELQTCANPFKQKEHQFGPDSTEITNEFRSEYQAYAEILILGRHLCAKCKTKLKRKMKKDESDCTPAKRHQPNNPESICINPINSTQHVIGKTGRRVTETFATKYCKYSDKIVEGGEICGSCRTKVKRIIDNLEYPSAKRRCTERIPYVISDLENFQLNEDAPMKSYTEDDTLCQNTIEEDVDIESDIEKFQYATGSESSSESSSDEIESSDNETDHDAELGKLKARDELNKSLEMLRLSPVTVSSDLSQKYNQCKCELKKRLDILSNRNVSYSPRVCSNCVDLLDYGKEKFRDADRRQKYTILTTVSKDISKRKLKTVFNCSKYMVKRAVNLRKTNGPFSYPTIISNASNQVSESLKNKVVAFYKSPNVSRILNSQRDLIRIKGSDEKVSKHQLLLTLEELYNEFIETNNLRITGEKISISAFYLLKPIECVWMGNKLRQRTCCCVIHENFNQVLSCFKKEFDLNWVLNNIPCNVQEESCMFGVCPNCPKSMQTMFKDLKNVKEITFYQWEKTDRVEMLQITETKDEFKCRVRSMLPNVLKHHYLVRKQNEFIEKWKESAHASPDEVLVKVDFAMNYNFVFQNEAQSAHWNRKQATVHPFFVNYYCTEEKKIKFITFPALSDHLKHDTVSFYALQCEFIKLLKIELPNVKKIVYVSDGCAAQYKCHKSITNLLNHERDFGLRADWEYFPTAHGKSECDAASANVKQTVRLESLRRQPGQPQITTQYEMYQFCKEKLTRPNRKFFYVSTETVQAISKLQERRFRNSKTIKGTRDFHSFRVVSNNKIEARQYSLQATGKQLTLRQEDTSSQFNINDHIAILFGSDFNIGKIKNFIDNEIIVEFYKKSKIGTVYTFSWPTHKTTHAFMSTDILCSVEELQPTSKGRRAFKLDDSDLIKILGMCK